MKPKFSDVILIIRPNGSHELVPLPESDDNAYQVIRKAIGGWLEGIGLTEELMMYVDEEGSLKRLEGNHEATEIVKVCSPGIMMGGGMITGPAVIVGSDGGERAKGIPDGFVAEIEDNEWVSLALVNYLSSKS